VSVPVTMPCARSRSSRKTVAMLGSTRARDHGHDGGEEGPKPLRNPDPRRRSPAGWTSRSSERRDRREPVARSRRARELRRARRAGARGVLEERTRAERRGSARA
jgi:hypothetical protein